MYYPKNVPRHLEYRPRPLQSLIEESAARYPAAAATSFFGATLTYLQLDADANRFAQALLGLGIAPGDRIAIHLPNCPQLLVCLHGALKAGAVATLINPMYEQREIAHQLRDAGARVLVTLSYRRTFRRAAAAAQEAGVEHFIVTGIKDWLPARARLLFTLFREKKEGHRLDGLERKDQLWLRQLMEHRPAERPAMAIDPGATALLLYTGGTTGVPKGAMLTHDNLVANATQARAWLYTLEDARERVLLVLPLFHAYGLTCCNLTLLVAGTAVLVPRFDLPQVLRTIKKDRPTLFPGIPAMYAAVNHSLLGQSGRREKPVDLSSIRLCVSGSDRLPGEVQRQFEELSGGRLVEGYGLTETSPVTHVNPIEGRRKPGSIGLPLPDTEARIVDSAARELPQGEIGELLVRGPQVMPGYWHQPLETAEVLDSAGWLSTGDLARVDSDGFYFIVDRKKDLIITGGINVYPREVEEVIAEHPAVLEVAVKGVPARLKGQTVKAFVVLRPGQAATAGDIRRFAGERLAEFKVPTKIEFIDALPRSTLRKVLKRKLGAG